MNSNYVFTNLKVLPNVCMVYEMKLPLPVFIVHLAIYIVGD